eukprot:CAMPEP_0170926826 /NCGR_PEP_ID=MMETSP0735-20130129/13120_1 /TAXON_ID=186038 /ORGANISM="Fragilariopsis kerguelensis, Strain L26-C5" /LENGTH=665 /DNA_ID=CAMNT_0011327191 /DNA_START=174 /DNA_END=2168 /DNA_ORIENTATION=-
MKFTFGCLSALLALVLPPSAGLPMDDVGIVGFCDETTNSNLHLLSTLSPYGRKGGVVPLTVSLPDMNDETGLSTVSVGLNCEIKPSSTCGRPNGLKCFRCGNSEGFDGHFVVNEETDFLIGVLNNAMDGTNFEIRTDGNSRNVQSQFRYRGVSMKDVTILVDGISVPKEEGIPVTLGPDDSRSAVREAYAPVRSSEALLTKRTDVDKVGRALASDDGSVVDLLYFFSHRAACQWLEKEYPYTLEADDQSALETLVGEINAYGNDALSDSGIPTSFNVVKVYVDLIYDEGTFASSSEMLYWVRDSPVAGNLRDEYKADLVVDVFYTGFGGAMGVGYVPQLFPTRNAGYSASGGRFSLLDMIITHEIGHNFGANHDRYVRGGGVDDESFYGYINCNECFHTIMSYTDECTFLQKCNSGSSVETIPYFSNPDLTYEGFSMGNDANNNVLQLTRSAPGIAMNQFSSDKLIVLESNGYTSNSYMAVKFDIVPKEDLILKNIELRVTDDIEISVYIVTGPYADVTDWGIPIVTETLTPLSKLGSKLRNVASYVSFPDTSLDENQVYAVKIEVQDNDTTKRMTIALLEDEGDYFENNDVTVKGGKYIYFSGNENQNQNAGLQGALIYDYNALSPITSSPSDVPSEVPSEEPSEVPSQGTSEGPSEGPSQGPS